MNDLFGASSDTILSGIVFLWVSGSWPLALIVFFASIMVPLVKLVAILLLILASKRRVPGEPVHWAALYRVVERIGRWSMLDVYVVALLVTLVRLRGVAYIEPAPGAACTSKSTRSSRPPTRSCCGSPTAAPTRPIHG